MFVKRCASRKSPALFVVTLFLLFGLNAPSSRANDSDYTAELVSDDLSEYLVPAGVVLRFRCGCPAAWRGVRGSIGFVNFKRVPFEFSGLVGDGTIFGFNFEHTSESSIDEFSAVIDEVVPIQAHTIQSMKLVSAESVDGGFEGFTYTSVKGRRQKRYAEPGTFLSIVTLNSIMVPVILPVKKGALYGVGTVFNGFYADGRFSKPQYFVTYSPARRVSLANSAEE
jgi:hypothetical protein